MKGMRVWVQQKQTGFTIVELLIVIVVVAILAAISIVAYSGIQDRAKYAKIVSDLQVINKSIQVYQAQNGTYPVTATWRYYCGYRSNPTDFIPGLDEVLKNIPPAPCTSAANSDDTWLYNSNGVDYKLLYLRGNVSGNFRNMVPVEMRDPPRWSGGTSFGFWTNDWKNT